MVITVNEKNNILFIVFFGKFSELVSTKPDLEKTKKVQDLKVPREKKLIKKILFFSFIITIIVIIIYTQSWITRK